VIFLFLYGFFSSFALWNNMTEASSVMIEDTNLVCPDYSKLSERQKGKIGSLQEQNEKLVKENEELLKKLQKHQQQTKKARFDLVQLNKNTYSTSQQRQNTASLNLINQNHLHLSDYIADCWLLNRNSFLNLQPPPDIAGMQTNAGPSMFVDWMDFSVEHMSHLWKLLNLTNAPDPTMFQTAIGYYEHYLETVSRSVSLYYSYSDSHSHQGESAMNQTIAMIAFQPMTAAANSSKTYDERADLLTAYSLAATIASLYQVGFGRILVVGYRDEDMIGVGGAFRLVDSTFKNDNTHTHTRTNNNKTKTKTRDYTSWNATMQMKGGTEIAYARIRDKDWVYTRHTKVSMVRGCIVGMQKALSGRLNETLMQQWLGNRTNNTTEYWKYVYLSEPDTILHTKPWILPSIRNQLDEGLSFYPHRIQPLPHESNFPSSHKTSAGMFLPSDVSPFSNITTLDPLYKHQDSCCDGGDVLPGRTKEYGTGRFPCDGYWWWACGFYNNDTKKLTKEEVRNRHKRLLEYPMVRFKDGSGLVWGSNERGRRCFPSKTSCPLA
jgi:hypothetical protein